MGGKLLKAFDARRLPKDQALRLGETVVELLHAAYDIDMYLEVDLISIVKSYKNKRDYGDVDILVPSSLKDKGIDPILSIFQQHYGPVPYFYNEQNLLSVGIPLDRGCFQVDLIFVDLKHFDFASHYFAFNRNRHYKTQVGNKYVRF